MTNEDLKRFYQNNEAINDKGDFVRLNALGKIPADVLPGFVDDVVEGYYYNSKFYEDSNHTKEIKGESGKIYIDIPTGNTYRWGGTAYGQIGGGGVASDISYDNTTSGLTATNVQTAIDEVAGIINSANTELETILGV